MKSVCDKCGKLIKDTQCECGLWFDKGDKRASSLNIYREALEAYKKHLENGMISSVISMDLPPYNICALFFEGTVEEIEILKSALKKTRTIKEEINEEQPN